ncbi:MAG TPA: DegT/DnrJ/EryC1/StrS family aminotransferase [Xanthobacteraceae bacterium]|nr:DegT/DnrJ/EryC1/StrS family aminotransferase [Xanthobacteraceae bacterium]
MSANRRFIPLHRPDLGDAECEAAARVIRSGWVAQGPEVEAFEREFAAFVGTPHAAAVANGTVALELALRALGIGAGDDIVTVSHSFIATANAVRAVGARPSFVDVEPQTLNLDPAKIEAAVTPETRAILTVHQVGMPCDLAGVLAVARRRNLLLIEDAACAAGSEIAIDGQWQRIGRPHGDAACFSFHGRKPITTGEGGMITCHDAAVDRAVRSLRNLGMTIAAYGRHTAATVVFEEYAQPGFNHRLSDIAAAVGREQLRKLPELLTRRRALAARYHAHLKTSGIATPFSEPAWARSNWQSYPVRLADHLHQREVMQRMLDDGIATRRGVMCAHLEPAWPKADWTCPVRRSEDCDCAGQHCNALTNSEQGRDRYILLPLYAALTDDEQDRVVAALHRACGA